MINTGNHNTGNHNTGNYNTGNHNTGNYNTGYHNTGYRNTGDHNTGDHNTGYYNTGNRNTGYYNTGNRNTGHRNTGSYNTGYRNTGDHNTGDHNTGDHNTGNRNTGSFNTTTPDGANFFNRWCSFDVWLKASKPDWIYLPRPTTWVKSEDMTPKEKEDHPEYKTIGGYLRTNDMKAEWKKAYESATEEEIQMVRDLPNFDYDVFQEITGLDLRPKVDNLDPIEDTCDGEVVHIRGKRYILTEF